ncbi:MAG: metal-sensitive transcriptional regulator [Limnochordia bacterium]|nr:metal-sensitive transcriptional regulator [Limnochordia bacterium]MDD2630713.1 metal-sensitive transcriptional regulator [Limnochordia bacterium]MDD4518225.1 metal-sensitive transcriptional regulator [Limnochordia bacterium]
MGSISLDEKLRPEFKRQIIGRLKRIEGQARGVCKMVEEDRSCEEVAVQLAALKAAITQVGITFACDHLAECMAMELAAGKELEEVKNRFAKIFSQLT